MANIACLNRRDSEAPSPEMIARARWRAAFDHVIRTPLSAYYVLFHVAEFRGMAMTGAWPTLYDGIVQFIAFSTLEDTSTYWIHRAFHESKWLYRTFHKVVYLLSIYQGRYLHSYLSNYLYI